MAPKNRKQADLGSCPYCGENLTENKYGWGCSNYYGGCKAFIFKEDNFFNKVIGRKIRKEEALKLIMGDTIHLSGIPLKGKEREIDLVWGKNAEGSKYPFGYQMYFEKDPDEEDEEKQETLYSE